MSSELRVDKIVPVDGVPTGGGGGIVQVKQIQHSTYVKYNTNSFTAGTKADNSTGDYSITITPKFNTSKILLSFTSMYDSYSGQRTYVTIYRSIGGGTASQYKIFSTVYQILDSPATTSEVTYKLQVSSWVGRNFYINRSEQDSGAAWTHGASSSMTAMEVSG